MPDNNLIGKTIDHFRVDRFLGQGGMAVVYEATDLRLQRQVAIKIMHNHLTSQDTFRERFVNEAQSAASLDHPNIVRVNSFTRDQENLYLVMELITGGNLRQYIKKLHQDGKFIDYPEAIEIIRQLAGALHYAHGRRMVHRDVKPDNVMLKPIQHTEGGLNYRPVLTDFGLARLLSAADEDDATAEQPIGTYPYMSPEQINAEPVDARADIYALGIMLYELSVGRLPYNPKTIAEAARMHGRDPLPLPTELRRGFPPRLEEIIVKALEKDRENRYSSAAEMAKALTAMTQEKKSPAAQVSRTDLLDYMDQYDTDVQTDIQQEPIAPIPPQPAPERTARDKGYDCLYFTNGEDSFIHRLVRDRTTIGREARQDVALESSFISREHAVLERKPNGKYYLLDVSESSGIWSETDKLRRDTPVILQHNAIFRIGNYWMQFLQREEAQDKPSTPPSNTATVDHSLSPIDDPEFSTDVSALDTNVPAAPDNTPPPSPTSELTETELPKQVPVDPSQYDAETLEQINETEAKAKAEQERKLREIRESVNQQNTPTDDDNDDEQIIDTQLLGIVPAYDMPQAEHPEIKPYQQGFDRLVVIHTDEKPRVILLEENTYTIGRAPANDIVFNSPYVSAFHAKIELDTGFYYITDLGSMNGTWFDNERLSSDQPSRISASKVIRIGDYWLSFEGRRDVSATAELDDDYDASFGDEPQAEQIDDSIDTAVMVRPLEQEMPYYSQPPLSNEMREQDRLIFYSDDHPLKIERLAKEVMTIGRGKNQDVQLAGKRVSRQHVILEVRRNGNLYLRDVGNDNNGSTNGTWIEDTRLVPDTDVIWGREEIVRIGNYWMKFEAGVKLIDPGGLQDDRGLIGKTIGSYQIDRFISHSHLSSVYKATDLQLQRDIALRILEPTLAQDSAQRQRFLEEARILSRLDHPNVVKVMSYNYADGEVFMVQELIAGGTLRNLLNQNKSSDTPMDLYEAVELVVQMANGLHYAHQQGLIHRDITPENVALKEASVIGPLVKYTPILTDFGIARYARTEDLYDDEGDTSFAYISPEAASGERTDVRSDIYELGIVLFELLAGAPPYQPLSVAEAIRMHTREPIPSVSAKRPGIPLDLETVVNKALQKTPNDRYQTSVDFGRALQRILPVLGSESGEVSNVDDQIDISVTQVMQDFLPRYMPLMTQPPLPVSEATYDRLILYSEQYPTQVYNLDKPIFTIGRGDDQDIILESGHVSRRHARIERSPDNVYRIVDVGSANGSWCGSYRLIANVIEIWDTEETVRIADYWLRIESKEVLNGSLLPPEPESMPEDLTKDLDDADSNKPPAIHHPQPEQNKIQVKTNTNALTVQAGSSVTLSIEVANLSDFVDHFEVYAVGLPTDWVTQPTVALDLLPNERETTSITFHPPRSSTSSEGHHAFEVRVTAEAKGISAVRTQCSLTILPFYSYTTSLYPDRIRNKGKVELEIRNTSNTFSTFSVNARDREGELRFNLEGVQYQLPPGYTESIILDVTPHKRHLFGQQKNFTYEVIVSPVPPEVAGGAQTQRGDFTLYPRLRLWYFFPLFLLMICLLIALGVFAFTQGQTFIADTTATALAQETQVVATATASANADDDGDGLPNSRETTLGTDPNKADTDEDGLNDGQEVQVYSTNPLNRDTDNDTLSDGDEVNTVGTSPTLPDTDGDGINDAQDPFPTEIATPTPSPFPTLEGGGICPNSPSPAQMVIGQPGQVEAGGVANRLRSDPSTSSEVIASMEPGSTFQVIDGPTCDPDTLIRFWKVDFNGLQGWTAEGEGDEYYIIPQGGASSSSGGSSSSDPSSGTGGDPTPIGTADPSTTSSTTGSNALTRGDQIASSAEAFTAVENTLANLPVTGAVGVTRNDLGIQLLSNVDRRLMSNAVNGITPLDMGWVKLQVSWRALQPDRPEITSQMLDMQAHINLLKSEGYKVLVSIVKAPAWARETSIEDGPPLDLNEFNTFIDSVLQLSGTQIDAIEIWNEPNLLREWNTEQYAFAGSGYMRLFDSAYNAIRAYSDDIVIITAGLAPTGDSSVSVQDRKYLRQMYNAGLTQYDNIAIGVHPFGWANSPNSICCTDTSWADHPQFYFLNTIATYKAITDSYRHDIDLWVTEFGWTTWNDLPYDPPEPWMKYLTTSQQVDYTIRAFEIGAALDYVGPMFLWNFNFANEFTLNNRDEMAGYSLVISDQEFNFRPREIYKALLAS